MRHALVWSCEGLRFGYDRDRTCPWSFENQTSHQEEDGASVARGPRLGLSPAHVSSIPHCKERDHDCNSLLGSHEWAVFPWCIRLVRGGGHEEPAQFELIPVRWSIWEWFPRSLWVKRILQILYYCTVTCNRPCWNLGVGFGLWPNTNSEILMAHSCLAGDGTKV
jgi:hypothetical protein